MSQACPFASAHALHADKCMCMLYQKVNLGLTMQASATTTTTMPSTHAVHHVQLHVHRPICTAVSPAQLAKHGAADMICIVS